LSRVEIAIHSSAAGGASASGKHSKIHDHVKKHHIHHAPTKYKNGALSQDGVQTLLSQGNNTAEYVRAKNPGDGAVFADDTDADTDADNGRWNWPFGQPSAASPLNGRTSQSTGMDWMQAPGKGLADEHLLGNGQASKSDSLKFCHQGKCTAIIDTGSNIIAGPMKTISKISKMLNMKMDCSNVKDLPPMKLHFGTFEATIPATAYTMKVPLPPWAKSIHGRSRGGSSRATSRRPTKVVKEVAGASLEDAWAGPARLGWGSGLGWAGSRWAEAGAWGRVFQDLHENRGIDLGPHFHGVNLSHLLSMSELCIPALVPIDKETQLGELWVVGTPLFEGYYTRWSWPKHKSHPTIYMKELAEASACGAAKEADLAEGPSGVAAPRGAARASLMRAEARRSAAAPSVPAGAPRAIVGAGLGDDFAQPRLIEVDDIRFPHWASHLDYV